jgi:hypothetical protein
LPTAGWQALERGPFLVALAATLNAGGTIVLTGGALYSAWKLRAAGGSSQRAAGCLLIAIGTVVVASGGTLTRFGRPEYLYLPMTLGIAIIFFGVVVTWRPQPAPVTTWRAPLIPLPARPRSPRPLSADGDEGVRYIVERLLPLDDPGLEEACRHWSATPMDGDAMNRVQARQVWALRLALPEEARSRFDALPISTQAQLAEIYAEVWSTGTANVRGERGA